MAADRVLESGSWGKVVLELDGARVQAYHPDGTRGNADGRSIGSPLSEEEIEKSCAKLVRGLKADEDRNKREAQRKKEASKKSDKSGGGCLKSILGGIFGIVVAILKDKLSK